MLNFKLSLVIFALIGVFADALGVGCTIDGLCNSNADCCEHYICASWHPDGYHCMTGCHSYGESCNSDVDCCGTDADCRKNVCRTKHGPGDAFVIICTTDSVPLQSL